MRIAYFCCNPGHLGLGALSIASAKKHMPEIEVVHLTDAKTEPLQGADTVLRFDTEGNFWKRYWTAAAALDGEVLLVGTDTIFRRDVSDLFAEQFEVALPHIADRRLRYDAGTQAVRTPDFFRHLAASPFAELEQVTTDAFLNEFAHCVKSYNGKIIDLPGKIYSFVPCAHDDPGIQSAAIVHYRGPRKRWMDNGWAPSPEAERWN